MLDSCEVIPTSLIQEQDTYFDSSVLLVHNMCVCAKSGRSFPFARHVLDWNVRRLALLLCSFYECGCVETVDGLVLVLQELQHDMSCRTRACLFYLEFTRYTKY